MPPPMCRANQSAAALVSCAIFPHQGQVLVRSINGHVLPGAPGTSANRFRASSKSPTWNQKEIGFLGRGRGGIQRSPDPAAYAGDVLSAQEGEQDVVRGQGFIRVCAA